MLKVDKINNSYLCYETEHLFYVRDYYLYCVDIIEKSFENNNYNLNIIFGNYKFDFPNEERIFKIDIQFEHTIVKPGGRDSENSVKGNIRLNEYSYYLVRIQNYNYLKKIDFVIDYSIPNILNIQRSGKLKKFVQQTTFISPLLFEFQKKIFSLYRKRNIITTFINSTEPRRKALLDSLQEKGLVVANIVNTFGFEEVKRLYLDSKILINIHQTDHHDTLEELRVLPALLCGCIIISEDVPLREFIPYHEYIIWSSYDSIADTVQKVQNNYQDYFDKIFNDENLPLIFNSIKQQNFENVHQMLTFLNTSKKKNVLQIILLKFQLLFRKLR